MRYQLHPRTRFRAVDTEGVVIQVHRDRVIVVNETGLRVMEILRADRQSTLEDLVFQLHDEFAATPQELTADIAVYLHTLMEEGLIEQVA